MSGKATTKKKEGGIDIAYELEHNFILRLPQPAADELKKELESGSTLLKDRLSIDLDYDMRHGHVRFNNFIYNSKVVDLPCIVEALKTVDKKTFYKTADISQMLVCTTDEEINIEHVESPKKKDKDKRYLWPHGITPPLKNVRKRRFRKTLKKKYMDQPELEKEVRRLFRYDAEAIDVKWEVLTEDEKPLMDAGQISGHVQSSGIVTNPGGGMRRNDASSLSLDIASFFGELSSSDEDEEEEKDINIMDSGEDSRLDASSLQQLGDSQLGDSQDSRMDAASLQQLGDSQEAIVTDAADDSEELQDKLKELVQQLEEIREKIMELESQMFEEDYDMMRDRIQEDLGRFRQEESEKQKEFEILSSMLNQG